MNCSLPWAALAQLFWALCKLVGTLTLRTERDKDHGCVPCLSLPGEMFYPEPFALCAVLQQEASEHSCVPSPTELFDSM